MPFQSPSRQLLQRVLVVGFAGALLLLAASVSAQEMGVEQYEPKSTLVVAGEPVTSSRFPFIDAHGHLRGADDSKIDAMVREMDGLNMATFVNLSGSTGERFRKVQAGTAGRHAGRFVNFANVDFSGIDDPGWAAEQVKGLEQAFKDGAVGLKIYKNLGMFVTDKNGRVPADDSRIDPIWAKCGELGIPVLIHVGEPSPFWEPHDENNERWLELKQYPNRKRDDATRFASFDQTMNEQHNIFRKHKNTKFINAHLGWYGNNLGKLGELLDEMPNMYTELGAVIAEIGRQPRTAKKFLERYQDRVLMGKDSWAPSEYHVYFRVLETEDEFFDYYRKRHAHWKMYGVGLSDEVLKKIYYKNALKIIPGLDASLFPE